MSFLFPYLFFSLICSRLECAGFVQCVVFVVWKHTVLHVFVRCLVSDLCVCLALVAVSFPLLLGPRTGCEASKMNRR